MSKITILPEGNTIEVAADDQRSLLEILKEDAEVYVKSSCGGHATCSDCIIKLRSGEDNVTAPSFDEIRILKGLFFFLFLKYLELSTMNFRANLSPAPLALSTLFVLDMSYL